MGRQPLISRRSLRGEAVLRAGKGKGGGVFQPGIPGLAADRNTVRGGRSDQHGTVDAWRAASHRGLLSRNMGLSGELLLILYCGLGNFASSPVHEQSPKTPCTIRTEG